MCPIYNSKVKRLKKKQNTQIFKGNTCEQYITKTEQKTGVPQKAQSSSRKAALEDSWMNKAVILQ